VTTLMRFTDPFLPSPSLYTGGASTKLVPDVFPVAINGRPYLVDQRSGQFARGFEARVRDSVDQSTAPGEAAINPQGLWRRGEVSWHFGAGQKYADTAEAQDYRFFSSKGVNPWTKGQLTLLNATKQALSSAGTRLPMVVAGTHLYVGDGNDLKYTTDPFASSPSWTSVTTGAPAGEEVLSLATDGTTVFVAYDDNAVYSTAIGGASVAQYYPTSGSTTYDVTAMEYCKGRLFAGHDNHIHTVPVSGGSHSAFFEHPNSSFLFTGFASGQNAIYAAGHANNTSLIYKITIKTDGTLDVPVVALELPVGEIVYSIHGYLGAIIIGTNKGVRYATADSNSNLNAGALIPTANPVRCFTSEDRFVWFGWSNYDGSSTGLGRLDLATAVAPNTPAHASDLMHASTNNVLSCVTYGSKRIFAVSGAGIYVEDADNLVATGEIVSGTYRWGIPDRKFVAKLDVRTTPLVGEVTPFISLDNATYEALTPHAVSGTTEHVATGQQTKFIEGRFKFELDRATATTGPTMTRWMARAYATPARSEVFRVPLLMHKTLKVKDAEYDLDVNYELSLLRDLIQNPRVITYQENAETYSVILEDMQFNIEDGLERTWNLEGTCIVTMRSVQD
jgi:hypothetical protein